MQILYRKSTGEILATLDGETEVPLLPGDDEDVLTTFVEHGGGVRHLRVDLKTKKLVSKSAIMLHVDKHEIAAGEPVIVEFSYEGEQFGDHFPLRVNHETVLAIPYNEPQIELTLELPGEYVLSIPDLRIHSIPQRIRVRENIQ